LPSLVAAIIVVFEKTYSRIDPRVSLQSNSCGPCRSAATHNCGAPNNLIKSRRCIRPP